MKNVKFVVVPLGTEEIRFIEAIDRRHAEDLYQANFPARLEKWDVEKGTARTLKERTSKEMETFFFPNCSVRVVNIPPIRVAEVYTLGGKMVHEIRTSTKGLLAARLARMDAIKNYCL